MKKIFTLVAAALVVAGLNAQEVGVIDYEKAGITVNMGVNDKGKEVDLGVEKDKGFVLAETESVVMAVGAKDNYKQVSAEANSMTTAIVGEASLALKVACQGSSNPEDAAGGKPQETLKAPAKGAFLTFNVKKDGYLYVFHKASSNKNYVVAENGDVIGFSFAMHTAEALWNGSNILSYTLEGNPDNYNIIDAGSAAHEQIKLWPEKIALGADAAEVKTNGASVIKVAVYKDCEYAVSAVGSKITCAGYIFSETDIETVKLSDGTNEVVLLGNAGTTALENVAASVVSSRYYLLSGEEVAAPQAGNTGLYIVKNIMSDGSVNVSKVVIK